MQRGGLIGATTVGMANMAAAAAAAAAAVESGTGMGDDLAQDERRQKRLARNRESARQSRRRKKQYLELLEEKVAQLTDEIDALRRMHLGSADKVLEEMRDARIRQLASAVNEAKASGSELSEDQRAALSKALEEMHQKFSPDCEERLAVLRFQFEELHELALPMHSQLLTWLLLQPDSFFRSRRSSSSERASANKIGERMMASGITTCGPDGDLWPLLCHELSLTYEQEEKLRQFQKRVVEDDGLKEDRRNMGAVADTLRRLEEAVACAAVSTSQRMEQMYSVLSPEQRIRYMDWLQRNRGRISASSLAQLTPDQADDAAMRMLATPDEDADLTDVLDLLDKITPSDEWELPNRVMSSLAASTSLKQDAIEAVDAATARAKDGADDAADAPAAAAPAPVAGAAAPMVPAP